MQNRLKVFLSGGTHGDWQDQIRRAYPECHFYDPRQAGKLSTMKEIAELEREWLDSSDILFFYFEITNPSGLGSAFEVGYCIAKNIPVIFIDEKNTSHTEWLGIHCNEVYYDLKSGIGSLRKYIK